MPDTKNLRNFRINLKIYNEATQEEPVRLKKAKLDDPSTELTLKDILKKYFG